MLLIDKNKIYVKDYQEILLMDQNYFHIRMNEYSLKIKGQDLEIYYYDHQELRLNGQVKVIEYDEDRI